MRTLANELAPDMIRVNAVLPNTVDALPVPWVEAVDLSNAVLFLASDEARYITGVPLPVDAGALVK